jgi:hypothetical protein
MKRLSKIVLLSIFLCIRLAAETSDNLVIEGIPAIPESVKQDVSRYLEFRSAQFNDWHPLKRQLLISTRFADTLQLHEVAMPLGFRRQLTFFPDRVSGVLDWPNAVIADAAFDVASTHCILRFVPPGLASVPRALRWLIRVGQPILAARYLRGYRRRRAIDAERLAYYQVAAAMRALVRAGEGRSRAGDPPPTELDRSAFADRLLAHVTGITGLAASLPSRPW